MRKIMWYVWLPVGIVVGFTGAYIGLLVYLARGSVYR